MKRVTFQKPTVLDICQTPVVVQMHQGPVEHFEERLVKWGDDADRAIVSKRVGSIRDVARETGLSIATISRVMNGSAKVSEKTRMRVLAACAELDYLPNSAARALSTRRSKTVAAIIPTIEHSVYAKFIAAVEQTLGQSGYALVLAISNADPEEALCAARKLLGMGAEAFILSGSDHSHVLIDLLVRRAVPHAFTSVWEADGDRPTIGYDNAQLAADALLYLRSMGHEHVAVLHGPLAASDRTVARRAGALSACSAFSEVVFHETELSVAGGKQGVGQVLARQSACTALLCFSDVLALGAYFGLAEAGKRVPDDMSVMGFDNLDWAKDAVPPLTTIDLPAFNMGEEVAKQIIGCLENEDPLRKSLLRAEIITRGSVARLK